MRERRKRWREMGLYCLRNEERLYIYKRECNERCGGRVKELPALNTDDRPSKVRSNLLLLRSFTTQFPYTFFGFFFFLLISFSSNCFNLNFQRFRLNYLWLVGCYFVYGFIFFNVFK